MPSDQTAHNKTWQKYSHSIVQMGQNWLIANLQDSKTFWLSRVTWMKQHNTLNRLMTSPPKVIWEQRIALAQLCNKVPIRYSVMPQIHPQNCPFPVDDHYPQVIHPSSTDLTDHPKWHFTHTDWHTDQPTDGTDNRSTPLVLMLAIFIDSDTLIIITSPPQSYLGRARRYLHIRECTLPPRVLAVACTMCNEALQNVAEALWGVPVLWSMC